MFRHVFALSASQSAASPGAPALLNVFTLPCLFHLSVHQKKVLLYGVGVRCSGASALVGKLQELRADNLLMWETEASLEGG